MYKDIHSVMSAQSDLVEVLARNGYAVAFSYRSARDAANEAVRSLGSEGLQVMALEGDVGVRADVITLAVRTEPEQRGPGGISLVVVEGQPKGLERTNLAKTGWWASDTAHLRFDGVRVPQANLVGEAGAGFKAIMRNFNHERLMMAAMACSYAEACTAEALAWARERRTFGAALVERQAIRHKLVEMTQRYEAARAMVYDLAWRTQHRAGDADALVARCCMAKVVATQAMQFCADAAVQILGGMGFMRGTKSERLYREVKVMMIGGGSEEIMKDLAARKLGL